MVDFSETSALTTRKNIRHEYSKFIKTQIFLVALLCFCFKKNLEGAKFWGFSTSRKIFAEYYEWNAGTLFQEIIQVNKVSKFQVYKTHIICFDILLFFCFRNLASKILNFMGFSTFKRTFGGFFQWNVRTHFHKICSRFKFIKNTQMHYSIFELEN